MARIEHSGNAVPTTITSGIGTTDTTVTLAVATGWPTGAVGEFYATIARGEASEERILVLSRTGTTLTLASSAKRGVDNTPAASHAAGTTIEHTLSAKEVDDANVHSEASTNVHGLTGGAAVVGTTTVQTMSGKTLTAPVITDQTNMNHTHGNAATGGVLPTAVPAVSAPGDVGTAGTGTTYATTGHKHGREAWATTVEIMNVATVESAGVSTTVPRGDHVHAIGAYATTSDLANIAAAEAEGTALTVPRGDHVHADPAKAAWTSWVPTLTGVTLGSGTVVARYVQDGKTVHWEFHLEFNTGTAITGPVSFTLPVAFVNSFAVIRGPTVVGTLHDSSTVTDYTALCRYSGTQSLSVQSVHSTSPQLRSNLSATAPFTWDIGSDQIAVSGTYEGA